MIRLSVAGQNEKRSNDPKQETYNNKLRITAGLTDNVHNGDNIPGQRNDSPESIGVLFGNTRKLSSVKSSRLTKGCNRL